MEGSLSILSEKYPDLAKEWNDFREGTFLMDGIRIYRTLPSRILLPLDPLRVRYLNAIAGKVFNLIGGSADLAPSNKTIIKCISRFSKR
jgi:transketolase